MLYYLGCKLCITCYARSIRSHFLRSCSVSQKDILIDVVIAARIRFFYKIFLAYSNIIRSLFSNNFSYYMGNLAVRYVFKVFKGPLPTILNFFSSSKLCFAYVLLLMHFCEKKSQKPRRTQIEIGVSTSPKVQTTGAPDPSRFSGEHEEPRVLMEDNWSVSDYSSPGPETAPRILTSEKFLKRFVLSKIWLQNIFAEVLLEFFAGSWIARHLVLIILCYFS